MRMFSSTFKDQIFCDLASNDFEKFKIDMIMIFKTYKSLQSEYLLNNLQTSVNIQLNEKIKAFMDTPHKQSIYNLISALTSTEHVFKPSTDVLNVNILKSNSILF